MFSWLWLNVFPWIGLLWLSLIALVAAFLAYVIFDNRRLASMHRQAQAEENKRTVEAACQAINREFAARLNNGGD